MGQYSNTVYIVWGMIQVKVLPVAWQGCKGYRANMFNIIRIVAKTQPSTHSLCVAWLKLRVYRV